MPRPKSGTPVLRAHISGQSVCRIGGVDFYLGRHGTPESLAKYAVLIREYQANGLSLPEDFTPDLPKEFSEPAAKIQLAEEPMTIRHLTSDFRIHAEKKYAHRSQDRLRINQICDELDTRYGGRLVNQFGPRALQELRQSWIDEKLPGGKSRYSRSYINRLVNWTVRVFKWGTQNEIVSAPTWAALKSVPPLTEGEATYETSAVQPVAIDVVRATAKHLSPIVRDMLRVQMGTGMRPSELCRMTPAQINRSGAVWLYLPTEHKTKKRGKTRVVPLVGDARDAITDYLNRDPHSPCFSPVETMAWIRSKQRAERTGGGSRKKLKDSPKKCPGDKYTPCSYRQAIQTAAKAAGVENWSPYQVRHLVGTALGGSLEQAKAMLGHANIRTTERYAHIQASQSIAAANVLASLVGNLDL
jgi:integrase